MPNMKRFIDIFKPGLIVSCQAPKGFALHGSDHMAAMAVAAEMGGGIGIRANGPEDIRAIRGRVKLPVLGIYKFEYPDSKVYITPTFKEAKAVADAGAQAVAIDATSRPRPGGGDLGELIDQIHRELKVPVMADCATFEEAVAAAQLGADAVASTLSGYTDYSAKLPGPDLALIQRLACEVDVPVVAEGRYHVPNDATMAILAGAHAVVVGTAITKPEAITEKFAQAVAPYLNR